MWPNIPHCYSLRFAPTWAGMDVLLILNLNRQTGSKRHACCPQSLGGFSWSPPRLKEASNLLHAPCQLSIGLCFLSQDSREPLLTNYLSEIEVLPTSGLVRSLLCPP